MAAVPDQKTNDQLRSDIGGLMAELASRPQINPGRRKLSGPERAAVLPTSAANLAGLIETNNSWWADNFEKADKRFKEWQLA